MEIGISRSGARERPARDGSWPWRSASLDLVRERHWLGGARRGRLEVGGLCEEGVVGVARGGGVVRGGGGSWWGVVRGGGGWALGREQRQRAGQRKRKEKGSKQKHHACFWKENGLRKIFP